MKRIYLLFFILPLFISFSCAQTTEIIWSKKTYKTLALSKIGAEGIARTAKELYNSGNLSEENLLKVKGLYEKSRLVNDLIINSLIISLELGKDPITNTDYNDALQTYRKIIQNLWDIAVEFNLIKKMEVTVE